jgi:hypothetical protein
MTEVRASAGRTSRSLKKHWPRLWRIFKGMVNRTENVGHSSYRYYGARGCRVCEAWKSSFKTFISWALSSGYEDTLTIDRIRRPDGGPVDYGPSTCRWVEARVNSAWRGGIKGIRPCGDPEVVRAAT